jgi:hypothetical protein
MQMLQTPAEACCRPCRPLRRRSGAAQYENGGIYVGEFQNDHRWGWGTHYFPQGDKYEGEWVDDQITGGWLTGCMRGTWDGVAG